MKRICLMIASGFTALTFALASPARGQIADPAPGQIVAPNVKAALSDDNQKTIDSFLHAAEAYLATRRAASSQKKLKPTTDVAEIERRREVLRQAVVTARPNAKQGDLFTPPVAGLFRDLLAKAMNGPDGNRIRGSLQHAEPGVAAESLLIAVNRPYPNQDGQPLQSAPATLLQHLPVLPAGLEYRLVGKKLVLRDSEANIIVDYLPDAIR